MYAGWSEAQDLAGIKHLGEGAYKIWSDKIGEIIIQLLEESMKKWRILSAVEEGLSCAIDARWSSRGKNAEECTVLCVSTINNKVIASNYSL